MRTIPTQTLEHCLDCGHLRDARRPSPIRSCTFAGAAGREKCGCPCTYPSDRYVVRIRGEARWLAGVNDQDCDVVTPDVADAETFTLAEARWVADRFPVAVDIELLRGAAA